MQIHCEMVGYTGSGIKYFFWNHVVRADALSVGLVLSLCSGPEIADIGFGELFVIVFYMFDHVCQQLQSSYFLISFSCLITLGSIFACFDCFLSL